MIPIKYKTNQGHKFALHILFQLENDDDHAFLKLEYFPWLRLLGEESQIAPIPRYGKPHLVKYSHIHYNQVNIKFQAYDLFEMLMLNLHFSTLMIITTWCHPLMSYMEFFYFRCMDIERYLTQQRNTIHINHVIVNKT
jgi:hypothetical protein